MESGNLFAELRGMVLNHESFGLNISGDKRLMRSFRQLCLILLVLILHGTLRAQVPPGWDATEFQVSRQELQDLLARYEAVISSPGYSGGVKEDARHSADLIRARLTEGDFTAGDRITLRLAGAPEDFPDTLLVERGAVVDLPGMGRISVAGILRSELQAHMAAEISRFVRNPDLTVQSLVRLSIQGAVRSPGFYVFPAEMLLGDVLMAAGGPQQDSRLDAIRIRRGEDVLLRGDEVQTALDEGRSIDQLGLRAGDEVTIPQRTPDALGWGTILRWGAVIASTLLLGVRIF
jgi:protein involved in polysaccharide export with SLBB domain